MNATAEYEVLGPIPWSGKVALGFITGILQLEFWVFNITICRRDVMVCDKLSQKMN